VTITAIFLDDGGVMNDNTRRAAGWQRLVGEFLAPRLGGAPGAWGEANQIVFERQWERFLAWEHQAVARDEYGDFLGSPEEQERWLREMCEHTGVSAPGRDACIKLAGETERYVLPRVHAAYPGAAEAVRELHARGYALHTASGGMSRELDGYLTGMGVRELFTDGLYGPDLVRAMKEGPHYHPRILAHAGVAPEDALIVDDAPHMLERAAAAGATPVQVLSTHAVCGGPWASVRSLAELPALLANG
jgi:HAD superfamily hydrolase (TIGR01509 family)